MTKRAVFLWLLLFALLSASSGEAQTPVSPSQRDVLENTQTTAAANTAVVVTLTGVAGQQHRIYGVSAYCSAGSSTITIAEATVTKFSMPAGTITTNITGVAWTPAPLTAARGATVVITLSTCGGGNTGILNVVADRY